MSTQEKLKILTQKHVNERKAKGLKQEIVTFNAQALENIQNSIPKSQITQSKIASENASVNISSANKKTKVTQKDMMVKLIRERIGVPKPNELKYPFNSKD